MQITISRELFLKPLMQVSGAIERKHTLPILSNVLLEIKDGTLAMTGTDLEIELVATINLEQPCSDAKITLPAKKLLDICKSLPDGSELKLESQEHQLLLTSGKSRFSLTTLAAEDFPNLEQWDGEVEFQCSRLELRKLLESTHFSMANQDVRYYLNGMSFEVDNSEIKTVATDGHRLAIAQKTLSASVNTQRQLIIPRKGVQEIMRLLPADDESVTIQFGANHVRLIDTEFTFTSKLVDGRFPDYRRVLPRGGDKLVHANREWLRNAFQRVSILSNEKFRGVRLNLSNGFLKISANNPEQEQAEEVVEVGYQGDDLEIGFNVSYVLDVLNTLKTEDVQFTLLDSNSSALIEGVGDEEATYVVMPMRL
ncbi:Beta sliding clamp [Pseudoalteromonas holothuriae]|uniref:Beta sliding clamp n=1 Tax=Pseudoalteromonas holothuriae TaxID=2963714 RepID=A0A9W4VRR7_9GAMM|nr:MULTISPECIES: DNA polymerase III subunit beta [unclassified Pseudoalteromonas]CAH9059993.1 Beta sliding clamp [Pseudoalteromonas sp. CIP111854]CAH9063184.1 Beta sliding clamp [Pseudoalteromonas sp. CIP111951]